MNDLISQLNQSQPQTVSLMNTVGKRGKNENSADFSSLITKASGRGNKPENIPASAKTKKAEDTKPAEELAAYASAPQTQNNPAPAENDTGGEQTSVASVDGETTTASADTAETTDVFDSAAEALAPILGEEEINQLVSLLGIEITGLEDIASDADFLPKLIALIDEKLKSETGTDIAPVAVQTAVTPQDRFNAMLEQLQNALTNPVKEVTAVVNVIETAAPEAAAVITEAAAAVITDTGETDSAAPDTNEPEISLPVEKHDASALENIRAKLAAHIAAQPVNNSGETENSAVSAETQTETDLLVQTEAPEEPKIERAQAAAVNTDEQTENVKDEKADAAPRTNLTQEQPSVRQTVRPAFTEQAPQVQAKVDTQNIIDQIVQSARMSRTDGTSQLEIQLRPEHLGKVSIVLQSGEDGVTAHIKAHNDTVRAMLGGGLGELMTSLKEMGVNMKNIDISKPEMSWDYTRNSGQQQFGGDGKNGGNQEHSRPQSRALRINNSRLPQLSNTLYGTTALQPVADETVSVDFIA